MEALEELQLKSMYMENIPYHAERLDGYMYAGGDGRVNKASIDTMFSSH